MAQQKLSDPNQALSGRLYHTHENINELSCCLLVDSFGWKPIPSEARVTRDFVPGYSRCARYCLPDRQQNNQTTKQLNNKTAGLKKEK